MRRHRPELGSYATHFAPTAMVCTVDHLATSGGLALLQAGGSAVDAAVAASAVLAVTTPHMCGMGGDLLALVHHGEGPPAALLATGRAGTGADPDVLRAEGHRAMPFRNDVRSVTVPGCVDGWEALHRRFGRLPMSQVLEPAIGYAEDGFPAAPLLAAMAGLVAELDGAEPFRDPDGGPLRPGGLVRRPGVARALRAVVDGGREGFYEGEFGTGLLTLGAGHFTPDDLRRGQADWVDAVALEAWGHGLWTVPPPSQGYLALAAAAVAEGCGLLPDDPADPRWPHVLVEASRSVGHGRPEVLHEGASPADLLAPDHLASLAAAIDPVRRADWPPVPATAGDTIYLCAVDGDRMGVSLIQSNAADFGAHLVEAGTGVFLHNRGIGFSLQPGHPAELGPGRRPPTTLSPTVVTRPDGELRAVAGTMGGDVQPQVVLQVLARLLVADEGPGRCVAAPRWILSRSSPSTGFSLWGEGGPEEVALEDSAPRSWAPGLTERGHQVRQAGDVTFSVGHAHLIAVEDGGAALGGGTDPRAGSGECAGL